jgi:DNA-binding MarR family transcriptional regulator
MPKDIRLDAWRALLTAHSAVIDVLASEMEQETGLPIGWYDVLLHLHESDSGRLRMHELAESVLLSRPATTRFIDRIQQAGLVDRVADPDDGRGTFVVMTAEGRAAFARAAPLHLAGIRRLFTDRLTDGEAEVMLEALRRVVDGVRGGSGPDPR